MTRQELRLLDNVIDSLDRLYDGVSKVVDVHAIIFATSEALKGSGFSDKAQPVLTELLKVLRSKESPERKRDLALGATDDLRLYVAGLLPPAK